MVEKQIGAARIEQTDETTTRVRVEYADGTSNVLFLEPGNGLTITADGPVEVEVFAVEDGE